MKRVAHRIAHVSVNDASEFEIKFDTTPIIPLTLL